MAYNFVPCHRDQPFLMPPSLDEWLPKDHLARFVIAVVDTLDLSAFYARRRADGWGRAAYDPKMMVALLIYAYATGARSSRLIERRCVEDVAFRFISANEAPDHATIARFARDHEEDLAHLFHQVLRLAAEVGLLRVGLIALDSTRIKANASPGANRTEDWIRTEVQRIIAEARATDEEEDRRLEDPAPEIPEDLTDPSTRLERLLAAKVRLEADQARRQAAYQAKVAAREEYKRRTGKGMRGRKPKLPAERLKDRERSKLANTTDPDSRTMGAANGGFVQGYQRPGGRHRAADRHRLRGHHGLDRLRGAAAHGGAGEGQPGQGGGRREDRRRRGRCGLRDRRQSGVGTGARRGARDRHQEPKARRPRRGPAAPRADPHGTIEDPADGPQAPDQARGAAVPKAGRIDRAGVRTAATTGCGKVPAARLEGLQQRVAVRAGGAQPAEDQNLGQVEPPRREAIPDINFAEQLLPLGSSLALLSELSLSFPRQPLTSNLSRRGDGI